MESERVPADWGYLSKKFLRSIVLDIVDDICLSKEQAILKFATDKKLANQLMSKSCDTHLLAHQLETHKMTPFKSSDSDMEIDSDSEHKSKDSDTNKYASADPYSWVNIENLFGGGFANSCTNQILHGKVLLQTYFSLCGYHTYFNLKNTIESLVAEDPVDKMYYHLRTRIRGEFWKDYNRTRALIAKKCKLHEGDRQSLFNDGSLERYMLTFLLQNDPDLIRILGTYDVRIETIPLFYGFGLFQGEKWDLKEAADVINEFHQTDRPFVLNIVLGIVNHWNLLVAFKRNKESKPLLIFLDSRNFEVLDIDEFKINEYVENRDNYIHQLTGHPHKAPFFKQYFKHCLYDVRMLLGFLEDTIYYQKYDLRQLIVKRSIHNILKSF